MTTGDQYGNLLARVALSDRQAFSVLYDRASAKLFGITLRMLKDRTEAEDALQEVFVRVWQRASTFQPGGSGEAWLVSVARNHCIDRLRARRPSAQDLNEEGMAVADPGRNPEQLAAQASEMTLVSNCLDTLPEDRAKAVRGAYLDGDSYEDLAIRHSVPLNTMRTWLRRSLIALRQCIEGAGVTKEEAHDR